MRVPYYLPIDGPPTRAVGVSTRLLIYAAQLIESGIPAPRASTAAIHRSLTDDPEPRRALDEMVGSIVR